MFKFCWSFSSQPLLVLMWTRYCLLELYTHRTNQPRDPHQVCSAKIQNKKYLIEDKAKLLQRLAPKTIPLGARRRSSGFLATRQMTRQLMWFILGSENNAKSLWLRVFFRFLFAPRVSRKNFERALLAALRARGKLSRSALWHKPGKSTCMPFVCVCGVDWGWRCVKWCVVVWCYIRGTSAVNCPP